MTAYAGRFLFRARQSVFFEADADPAEEAAHHRCVSLDWPLGQQAVAKRLKRDVAFLGPRRLEKIPERHECGWPPVANRLESRPDDSARAI